MTQGDDNLHTVHIVVNVPDDTPTLYMPGNLDELGPWDPAGKALEGEGARREITLEIEHGRTLEFKFSLGSWGSEALAEDGSVPGNHRFEIDSDLELEFTIEAFSAKAPEAAERPTAEGSGVIGTLLYHYDVDSEYLFEPRHVAVWLPPGYDAESDHRYPALYMHDGQNVFDPRLSFTGIDWGVDEAVVRLVERGKIPPIIVVGVFNTYRRSQEYDPLDEGELYGFFLTRELKPMIDATYRTRPEAEFTGTMGSSLGGMISLGLGWIHPDVFTRLGCLSAYLGDMHGDEESPSRNILNEIEASGGLADTLRIYLDLSEADAGPGYPPQHARLAEMLKAQGRAEGSDFVTLEFEGTEHTEASWRKRLEIPLEFLFGDLAGQAERE